jgi:hypothetical protein
VLFLLNFDLKGYFGKNPKLSSLGRWLLFMNLVKGVRFGGALRELQESYALLVHIPTFLGPISPRESSHQGILLCSLH